MSSYKIFLREKQNTSDQVSPDSDTIYIDTFLMTIHITTLPKVQQLTDEHIQCVLEYGSLLEGTPYKWWTGEDLRTDGQPFWSGGTQEVPIHKITACSCTGLLNLIRRRFGLSIPGSDDVNCAFPGGTYRWFQYLSRKMIKQYSKLKKFATSDRYPKGSLLFRPYSGLDDQGHVAIIFSDDKSDVLDNSLLHCYPNSSVIKKDLVYPGIIIDPDVRFSHYWEKKGSYKFVFPPEIWLTE